MEYLLGDLGYNVEETEKWDDVGNYWFTFM